MKTNYAQLARIADPTTLRAAWEKIRSKGSSGGVDGQTVKDFSLHAENNLSALREELLTGSYVPSPLQRVYVEKLGKPGQTRPLLLPTIRDKIAQEATRRIISPFVERHFLPQSFGYRKGMGPRKAIEYVSTLLKSGPSSWIVQLDIDEFFPSIDHTILLDRLRLCGVDEPVCRLLLLWLEMGLVSPQGRWMDVFRGIGQGFIVSPLLANLYLHPLDEFLSERGIAWVRFADDIRLFFSARKDAEAGLKQVSGFLETQLKLRLNDMADAVVPAAEGFNYLGLHFVCGRLLIDPSKWPVFEHKLQRIFSNPRVREWSGRILRLNNTVAGWKRYYGQLVETSELERLEKLVLDAVAAAVCGSGGCEDKAALSGLRAALERLDLLLYHDHKERSAMVSRLLERVRSGLQQQTAKTDPTQAEVQRVVRRERSRYNRKVLHVSHLVVTTPGLFIGKRDNRLILRQGRRILYETPLSRLQSITVACRSHTISSDIISHCARNGVNLCWVDALGKIQAVLQSVEMPSAKVQVRQLEVARDPKRGFEVAEAIVRGKIKNQIHLIKYFGKYEKTRSNGRFMTAHRKFLEASSALVDELKLLQPSTDWPHLRGHLFSIEGRLAAHYWDMFTLLLDGVRDFPGRMRQGATDLVNQTLNYGYAILRSRVNQEIHRLGLTPYVGFLHVPGPKKEPLTYDLMEIFRPQCVDRIVLAELRRKSPRYHLDQDGRLSQQTRRQLISKIYQRLETIEKYRGKELKLGEIIRQQVTELRRHLLGQAPFRPYLAKW